jgi:hypothetical protein
MKSEPVTKILIGGTLHSSVSFQSVIKLLTVPISLIATGEHVTAEVLTALTYRPVSFQSVI